MANMGLIDFKLGLYITVNVNEGQNKLKVHISKHLVKMAMNCHKIGQEHYFGITRSFFIQFLRFFLICSFLNTNRLVTITKLYFLLSRFWFLLRGLTLAVLHVWTQNYPQNVRTCPGLPLQLLARNTFFQSDRPEPPTLNKHRNK